MIEIVKECKNKKINKTELVNELEKKLKTYFDSKESKRDKVIFEDEMNK